MDGVLKDIPKEHHLHHVDNVHDASKPAIPSDVQLKTWPKEELLHEVQEGVPLKHVDPAQVHDSSEPKIDPNVHLQPNQHKEMMTEVKAAAAHVALVREIDAVGSAAGAGDGDEDVKESPLVAQLHHVVTDDKAKPAIDPNIHVQKWDKEGLLAEVRSPHQLHHVDPAQVHDGSAPVIPPDARLVEPPARAVLEQISSGELPPLKHVEAPR